MEWFLLAIVALVGFTGLFLLIRKITDLGVRSDVLLLYYFGLAALILLIYTVFMKTNLGITKYAFLLLLVTAILGVVANIFLVQSIKISPNPGYALAVSGVHILLVAFASIFIFKSEFTLMKGIGTVLAVLGIILLGL